MLVPIEFPLGAILDPIEFPLGAILDPIAFPLPSHWGFPSSPHSSSLWTPFRGPHVVPQPPPILNPPLPTGWAAVARFDPRVRAVLEDFRRRPDTFSLGVCNGCQLMALLGWVGDPPGGRGEWGAHGGGGPHKWVGVLWG